MIKKRGTETSGKKEQAIQQKITVQLEEINQKALAKDGRLQRYRQRRKQYREKQDFPKQQQKILLRIGRE